MYVVNKLHLHDYKFFLFPAVSDASNIPDIDNLMNTVSLIQNHWYTVGTRLDLPEDDLKKLWTEASQLKVFPKETYCCCKMLLYWHKEGKIQTVEHFLHAINFPPFCFDETLPLIKNILLDETTDKSVFSALPNEVNDTDRQFALLITEVAEILSKCNVDLDKYKQYLDHCKSVRSLKGDVDKHAYEHATNFSDLIRALENNGYITHAELSWLKYLVHDVANSSEALHVIQKYEAMNVAQMLHWHSISKAQASHEKFLMAKTDKSPAMLNGEDLSNVKSATTKFIGINETDAMLNSAGVGSVIIYWKVADDVRVELPESITQSLSRLCSKAGITHIGTVVNQNVTLVEVIQMTHTSKCII